MWLATVQTDNMGDAKSEQEYAMLAAEEKCYNEVYSQPYPNDGKWKDIFLCSFLFDIALIYSFAKVLMRRVTFMKQSVDKHR